MVPEGLPVTDDDSRGESPGQLTGYSYARPLTQHEVLVPYTGDPISYDRETLLQSRCRTICRIGGYDWAECDLDRRALRSLW